MRDGVKEINFNSERIQYWLSVGAQPSDRVNWILSKIGLIPTAPVRTSMKYTVPKAFIEKT